MALSVLTFIVWITVTESGAVPGGSHPIQHRLCSDSSLLLYLSLRVLVLWDLSVPCAVMVGCGVGEKNGILVKGGAVLETAHSVIPHRLRQDATLTQGVLSVRIDRRQNVSDVLSTMFVWQEQAVERSLPPSALIVNMHVRLQSIARSPLNLSTLYQDFVTYRVLVSLDKFFQQVEDVQGT